MAEAEAPGHVGVAHEIELQKLVDCVHRRSLGRIGCRGGQLGLEGIAGHRRSFQHAACAVRQKRELFVQRRGDGGRNVDARQ